MSSNFGQIGPLTTELAALECLKKYPHRPYNGENGVSTRERGGSVVACRIPKREVGGSRPTAAVLCP